LKAEKQYVKLFSVFFYVNFRFLGILSRIISLKQNTVALAGNTSIPVFRFCELLISEIQLCNYAPNCMSL